jgi:glycosyltransferase involved in cell wall biosynthesis
MLPKDTLIHLHIAQALVPEITMLVAKLRGFRVVAHFHLDVEPSGRLGWLFVLYKKYVLPHVLRSADAVLIASEGQAEFLSHTYGVEKARLHLITNGVDSLFFKESHDCAPHTPLRILTVSRLTIQKRVDRLIDAMKHMKVPAQLVVIGDGEDRKKLEAQASALGPQAVEFVGFKTPHEISEYHTWADIFVIPSDKEGGMPLTVIEAMAAGLPVVAADAPGVTDVVAGTGIVVTNPTPERLAESITTLATHPETMSDVCIKSRACAKTRTWDTALETVFVAYGAVHADMVLGTAVGNA